MSDDVPNSEANAKVVTQIDQPQIDAGLFRTVLGHFCSGITIITAVDDGQPVGLTCQSFSSCSLDPPLVTFLPAKSSSSWPRIRSAGSFCINILAADQEALCRGFAMKGADKFEGVGYHTEVTGSPVLDGALAWIDCVLYTVHDGGDHDIVLGLVQRMAVAREGVLPLMFFRGGYGSFAV